MLSRETLTIAINALEIARKSGEVALEEMIAVGRAYNELRDALGNIENPEVENPDGDRNLVPNELQGGVLPKDMTVKSTPENDAAVQDFAQDEINHSKK